MALRYEVEAEEFEGWGRVAVQAGRVAASRW
jgi:hypothetical protein